MRGFTSSIVAGGCSRVMELEVGSARANGLC